MATGPVDELRDRGRRGEHVRVRVEGDGDGRWLAGVPGAELVEAGPRGVLVRLLGRRRRPSACSTPPAPPAP